MSTLDLRGQFIALTTFRKDGSPVPTTVWFTIDDGDVLVPTGSTTGKVKRIRDNPRVTIVRSSWRGRPKSDVIMEGTAHVVDDGDAEAAMQLLRSKYGIQWNVAGRKIDTVLRIVVDGTP